jgi:spore coat polysaccharide biosynthesis protein SpsF
MDRFGIVIQARLGSTRFPRKIEKQDASGNSILELCVEQAKGLPHADVVVCAPEDEKNEAFWRNFSACPVFYGSHGNVLERYNGALQHFGFHEGVRLTADNPYLSPNAIVNTVQFLREHGLDYVSSKRDDGAMLPYGVGCEAFTAAALQRVAASKDAVHQEHVSEAFLECENTRTAVLFRPLPFCTARTKELAITIDYPEQFELLLELGLL